MWGDVGLGGRPAYGETDGVVWSCFDARVKCFP